MVADERIVSAEAVRTVPRRRLDLADLDASEYSGGLLSHFAIAGAGRAKEAAEAVDATRVLDPDAATVAAGFQGGGLAPGLIAVNRARAGSAAPTRLAARAPRLCPDV